MSEGFRILYQTPTFFVGTTLSSQNNCFVYSLFVSCSSRTNLIILIYLAKTAQLPNLKAQLKKDIVTLVLTSIGYFQRDQAALS
jgi:hypothetical protein